jgi:hypothetical protein
VEAEKCWEVKGPAQGRWKQKGGGVESQEMRGYLGQFLFVVRAININQKNKAK